MKYDPNNHIFYSNRRSVSRSGRAENLGSTSRLFARRNNVYRPIYNIAVPRELGALLIAGNLVV
jgi:hypothetical protein